MPASWNFARLARKLLTKHEKARRMSLIGKWRRLTQRLLQERASRKLHVLGKWRRLATRLLDAAAE